MGRLIHPSAEIHPTATLGNGVSVGPGAVIGADVEIGESSVVGAGAQIEGPTVLGTDNHVFPNACVGFDPQDLKYKGERSRLEIGSRNQIREFSTINRGTDFGGGVTRIGDDNLFMAYTHVGHDSQVGSRTVFTNGGTLAGHCQVSDDVTIGAFSSVHQFTRVGAHAYIGGYSVITMDALPFSLSVGIKPSWFGVNKIGLSRKGWSEERIEQIENAFRILLRRKLELKDAFDRLRDEHAGNSDVELLMDFIAASERGWIRAGRRGSRGKG